MRWARLAAEGAQDGLARGVPPLAVGRSGQWENPGVRWLPAGPAREDAEHVGLREDDALLPARLRALAALARPEARRTAASVLGPGHLLDEEAGSIL